MSFGIKGAHYTIGPRGRRATVGIPGTGLSYTTTSPKPRANSKAEPPTDADEELSTTREVVMIGGIGLLVASFFVGGWGSVGVGVAGVLVILGEFSLSAILTGVIVWVLLHAGAAFVGGLFTGLFEGLFHR